MEKKTLRTWHATGPSGPVETVAEAEAEAEAGLRCRLSSGRGMPGCAAESRGFPPDLEEA